MLHGPENVRTTAVFDLDGTLLDLDSTACWMQDVFQRAWLRAGAAFLAAPIALPMVLAPPLRKAGASSFLWIATAGVDEAHLMRSFEIFANRISSGAAHIRWREKGLATLDRHIAEGDQVVVVTAAPELMAKALFASIGRDVQIIGSTLKRVATGWVADRHCRHQEKCVRLVEAGYGDRWSFGYSDNIDDLPLLARTDRPKLVNGSDTAKRRLVDAGLKTLETLSW
jgi:phosphatidylglycerophosphatase C